MTVLQGTQIAFIGGGTMAEAFIKGMLTQDLAPAENILVSEPVAQRREFLESELGVRTANSNAEAVESADLLILAIKPQVMGLVLGQIADHVRSETVVLTFVAGVTIETIRSALGSAEIVRVMPNTPGQIGQGISVWTTTEATSDESKTKAQAIVGALGPEIHVGNEGYIDMATALSGSGPAYVFLFIESLADAGVRMGFARPVAEQLALQTVLGSALYARQSDLHLAELRNRVTSPGGTTAEALHMFEKGGLRALVSDAVMAAYDKAKSLGESKH